MNFYNKAIFGCAVVTERCTFQEQVYGFIKLFCMFINVSRLVVLISGDLICKISKIDNCIIYPMCFILINIIILILQYVVPHIMNGTLDICARNYYIHIYSLIKIEWSTNSSKTKYRKS